VYSFRKATQDRYLYDPSDGQFVHLRPTPFALDDSQNATLKDTPRQFGEVSKDVLALDVVQRIYKNMADLNMQNTQLPSLPEVAPDERRILVSVHFFMIHTEAGSIESADAADVTPEGVHQDGAEHVKVLLLGRENVDAGSARSQIFSLQQGIGPSDENSPELLYASELKEPGEAIFMADRLVKHAVSPVRPADPNKPAWRMVMVAWSRRPTDQDCLARHEMSPCPKFSM